MVDCIEPVAFLVALALLVLVWLIIGIRALRRARRRDAVEAAERLRAAVYEREHILGMCAHTWRPDPRWSVAVCTRPYEHSGPHYNDHRDVWDR